MFSLNTNLDFGFEMFENSCIACFEIWDHCTTLELDPETEGWLAVILFKYLLLSFWIYINLPVFDMDTKIIVESCSAIKNRNMAIEMMNTPIFWWETWSYCTITQNSMENELNSTWNNYKKYRLSIWNNWHILEDRILIFLLIFLTFSV
jgi:hypothetical protein